MADESHDPFEAEPKSSSGAAEQRPEDVQPPSPTSAGIAWGAILLLLVIAGVVIFAVQNTDAVPVRFLWMEGTFSLAIVLLIAVGAIVVLTELIGISYRKRRRRRRSDIQELKRFRSGS